jgi:hypothetical protein
MMKHEHNKYLIYLLYYLIYLNIFVPLYYCFFLFLYYHLLFCYCYSEKEKIINDKLKENYEKFIKDFNKIKNYFFCVMIYILLKKLN